LAIFERAKNAQEKTSVPWGNLGHLGQESAAEKGAKLNAIFDEVRSILGELQDRPLGTERRST
jgi:hypothetical protein